MRKLLPLVLILVLFSIAALAQNYRVDKVFVGDGTSTDPSITFSGNKFDGFYRLSTGVVIWTSNGTPSVLLAGGVGLGNTTEFRWAPDGNLPGDWQANLMDVGIGRLQAGILKVSRADVGGGSGGAIDLGDPGARPSCTSAVRGTIWIEEGGASVKDIVAVCAKDASDVYDWRVIY